MEMIESIRSKDQTDEATTKKPRKQATKPESTAPAMAPAVTPVEAVQEAHPLPYDWDARKKADQAARDESNLRTQMVKFVADLGKVLNDHAAQLAKATGEGGAFEEDNARDLLTWQLCEFLARGEFERNPAEPPITRGWQVTAAHARDFFAVDTQADGSLVAREIEAKS